MEPRISPTIFDINNLSMYDIASSLICYYQTTTRNWLHGALINCTFGSNVAHQTFLMILLCLSTNLFSSPVRSSAHCLDRPQPYLTSTQTYIHQNKLPPAYITSTARSRNSPTHPSLLTATLLLCGDIQPNPGLTHPANLLFCSMLTAEHVTTLNDLTDNHKPDNIALTETWIRSSTTLVELIDFTPPGYSLCSAPLSHTGNPSKPILAEALPF